VFNFGELMSSGKKAETDILDIERGIAELALKFGSHPEIFNRERDFDYELHDILLKKTSLKLRWELITNEFYRRFQGILNPDLHSNHTLRDFEKLSNRINEVQNGYILCFVKSEIIQTSTVNRLKSKIKKNNENKDILWQILKSNPVKPKIKIALIECDITSGVISPLIIRDLPDKWLNNSDIFGKKT